MKFPESRLSLTFNRDQTVDFVYDHMPVGSIVFWHEAASLQSLKNTYPSDWQSRVDEFTIGTNRTVIVPKGWIPCYGNVINENIVAPNFGNPDGVEPYYFAATPNKYTGVDKFGTNSVKLRNTDIPNHYHNIDISVSSTIAEHTHKITGGEHAHITQSGDAGFKCGKGNGNWDASDVRYDINDSYRYSYNGMLPKSKNRNATSADVIYKNGVVKKGHEHTCEPATGGSTIQIKDQTLSSINNKIVNTAMTPTTAIDKKPATVYVIPIMKYRNIK